MVSTTTYPRARSLAALTVLLATQAARAAEPASSGERVAAHDAGASDEGTPRPASASADTGASTPPAEKPTLDKIVYTGFQRVRTSVVEDVLPRPLPATLSDDELRELERRLWTMAIFDDVLVAREGSTLHVTVREKWTLVPSADFGTSRTLRDSYFLVSLAEYNLFGRAQELGAYVAYGERAVSAEAWWAEQQTSTRRLSFEGAASWVGSGIFFTDSAHAWERRRTGGRFGVRLPFAYGQRFRFGLFTEAYRESLDGTLTPKLADGTYGGLGLRATWDRYSWNDLAPSGIRVTVEASPGALARGDRLLPRHSMLMQVLGALPLSSHVVLALNVVGEAVSPGDPNHSVLLGNLAGDRFAVGALGGVRGLSDNVHRNTAHAFGNLELRGALTLAPRWYLQGVAFVDGGTFASMNALGETQHPRPALSTGLGVRLLPTAIASFVPRVDAGRRLLPDGAMFWTFGLSQYF
jgi:hypothetical protein